MKQAAILCGLLSAITGGIALGTVLVAATSLTLGIDLIPPGTQRGADMVAGVFMFGFVSVVAACIAGMLWAESER